MLIIAVGRVVGWVGAVFCDWRAADKKDIAETVNARMVGIG